MEPTELDSVLVSIQHLAINARETIRDLAVVANPMLIVESANILEDIERLESAYTADKFLRDLETEYLTREKTNAE